MVLQNFFFTHQIEHFIHSQQMNSGNVTIPTNFWNSFMETTMNLMETWEDLMHTAASKQCIKLEVLFNTPLHLRLKTFSKYSPSF